MLNMLILFTNFHCTRHERRCAADCRAVPRDAMRRHDHVHATRHATPCTDRVVCALLSRAVEAYDKRVPRPRSAPGKHKAARKRLSISFDSSGWFFVCAPLKPPSPC